VPLIGRSEFDESSEVRLSHSSEEAYESTWSEGDSKSATNLERNTEGTRGQLPWNMSDRRMRGQGKPDPECWFEEPCALIAQARFCGGQGDSPKGLSHPVYPMCASSARGV
jgi:hypothetical protein